eukprot:CAMPEP_0172316690 /NCGR_PEP_ID=MMETSP1058-20130122/29104_1 /TAXON_ID=83371 /ORGANISM="Detonula confervacea, Strain CCMP 353" /LENGTH=1112 /DNA_ID=CAMNT_0013031057 /DNA_START=45 /DNA_END=3380 /DNA_ORIENTATION=-
MPPYASMIVHLLGVAYLAHAFAPSRTLFFSRSNHCLHPTCSVDRLLSPMQVASSKASEKISENKSNKRSKKSNANDGKSSPQPKRKHDRTIDRRKSPALWRDDLEYSIAPIGQVTEQSPDNQQMVSSNLSLKGPPELMSPAGGWPQLKAAVANGADAVYLGLTSYSARARAANFDPDPMLLWREGDESDLADGEPCSLARAVQFAHTHNVRVYVAFNTLVFDEELHEVQGLIEQVWECGVDAVIVQDVGVAKIVTEVVNRMSMRMDEGGLGVGKGLNGAPLEIHASTQQTVTCADGVSFAAETTNATRVVVGRELSLTEIAQISTNTDTEIEAFVHGALCVSYSGQCFSSEAWGGRSANRGQCAQACRLPYGLIANGELKHLSFDGIEGIMGGNKAGGNDEIQYLLSPQDLCGLEQVEGLVAAGVSCLKIEGRLKDASYVAATTRAYRQAIDAAWNKVLEERSNTNFSPQRILSSPDENVSRSDLTHVFARGQDEKHDGLTPGFFEGPKHQRLVRGRSPRHRGMHVGRVVSSDRGALIVKLDDHLDQEDFPLKRGDGIVVDRGMAQERELGGPIYDVKFIEGKAAIRFGREVERQWKENDQRYPTMTPKGSHVWKTADAEIGKRMRRLAELNPPRSPAKVTVEGRIGEPLTVRIIDEISGKVGVASSLEMGVLEEATGSAINAKSITKAIGTLGNSRWGLSGELDLSQLEGGLWCPMSWVKDTRRRALESLEDSLGNANDIPTTHEVPAPSTVNDEAVVDLLLDKLSSGTSTSQEKPTTHTKLSILARNYDQVDAICTMIENMDDNCDEAGISEVIVDFLEIDGIRAAVSRIREVKARSSHDLRVVVASPRIIKPGEEGIWRTLLKTNPDGILVRSTGLLYRLTQLGGAGKKVSIKSMEAGESIEVTIPELIGDFSLNAANAISAYELLQSGLSRITAAYDLNANAVTELATLLGKKASQLEVVVHQHMPIFHTEHCVFARFLSKGESYQDCGHVCTGNTVHLRDQNGKDNLVLADMGCRNTVFMSEAQSGVYDMEEWIKAGVRHLRIELVDESGADAVSIVSSYLQSLTKEKKAVDVWNVLQAIPDSNGRLGGVGIGSLRNAAERRSGELS